MIAAISMTRLVVGAAGALFGLFGVYRLGTEVETSDLLALIVWLVAALLLHDAILSPVLALLGAVIARLVPPRARRCVQPALVVALLATVIALPLIHRENSQPRSKAILQQDYAANHGLVLAIVTAVALVSYVVLVVRDHRPAVHPTTDTNERPPDVHDSDGV